LNLRVHLCDLHLRVKVVRFFVCSFNRCFYRRLHTAFVGGAVHWKWWMVSRQLSLAGRNSTRGQATLNDGIREEESDDQTKQDADYSKKKVIFIH